MFACRVDAFHKEMPQRDSPVTLAADVSIFWLPIFVWLPIFTVH